MIFWNAITVFLFAVSVTLGTGETTKTKASKLSDTFH